MTLLLALLVVGARAEEPAALVEARHASGAFPEDYALAVAWAVAAGEAERWAEAERAWARAAEVSAGSLEALLGLSWAMRMRGRPWDALAVARQATAAFPAVSRAHLAVASSWAAMDGPVADRAWVAWPAVRRAVVVGGEGDAAARCVLAANRAGRGDVRAAARVDEECAGAPQRASHAWGTLSTVGAFTRGGASSDTFGGYVGAGARLADLVTLQAVYRGWYVAPGAAFEDADGVAGSNPDSVAQHEGWGSLTLSRAGHGVRLTAAGFATAYGGTAERGVVLGAQAFATGYATWSAELVWTDHPDGTGWQGALGVRVPVVPMLALSARVQGTGLAADDADADAALLPSPWTAWSGSLRADLTLGRWTASAGARVGTEVRPVRLDEPTLWNRAQALGPSAFASATARVSDAVVVGFGYEAQVLKPLGLGRVSVSHTPSLALTFLASLPQEARP